MAEDKIVAHDQREHILKVPKMYIGRQWDAEAIYILIFHIMRYAVLPECANQCDDLEVIIEGKTVLSIIDNGRGLPIKPTRIGQSIELPKIEHVFSHMFTTNPLPAYYEEFGFLNYLGFVLNAVSDRLEVETCFEGNWYTLTCARGEIIHRLEKIMPSGTRINGTRLTFIPDPEIFPEFRFEVGKVYAILLKLQHEFPTINLKLEDKTSGQKIEIQSPI